MRSALDCRCQSLLAAGRRCLRSARSVWLGHGFITPSFWYAELQHADRSGTLGSRFCSTAGSGKVHAKTGSLSISIALSGYIDNPNDNQRYLFSFIGNRTSIDQTATRDAIDAAVVLMGARGVPISPLFSRIISKPNGTSIQMNWPNDDFVRIGCSPAVHNVG